MSFATVEFYIFFLVVFSIYILLAHKQQNIFLLAASYIFYAYWDWRFLSLLFVSSTVDYFCGLMIGRHEGTKAAKWYLNLALVVNLTFLGFFKSFNFFISSLNQSLTWLGLDANRLQLHVILPLGISFYTFQSLGYIIDVYRGQVKPIRRYTDYLLFVSFFPQLIAGPIERAGHLYRQIANKRVLSWDRIKVGAYLIYWGLFKKVFVADHCAILAERLLSDPSQYSGAQLLVSLYAFAFQIYCDISGYTDIARGVAKMMGFDLTINFRLPYFSTNISDFWRRWHMSMTFWFRDYVFFPVLVRTRGNAYFASFLTLLCISLWHSISLNSIFRGIYFGAAVAVFHFIKSKGAPAAAAARNRSVQMLGALASGLFTFHIVCLGWVFFYPSDIKNVLGIFTRICQFLQPGVFFVELRGLIALTAVLIFVEIWQALARDEFVLLKANFAVQAVLYWVMFWLLFGSGTNSSLPFIYFGF